MKILSIHIIGTAVLELKVPDDFNISGFWNTAIGYKDNTALTVEGPNGVLLIPQSKVLLMRLETAPNHEGTERRQ